MLNLRKKLIGIAVLLTVFFTILVLSSCGEEKIKGEGTMKYLTEEDYLDGNIDEKLKDSLTVGIGEKAFFVVDYTLKGVNKLSEDATVKVRVQFSGSGLDIELEEAPTTDYADGESSYTKEMTVKVYDSEKSEKRFRFIFSVSKKSAGKISAEAQFIIPEVKGKEIFTVEGDMYPFGSVNVDESIIVESKLDYELSSDGSFYTVTGIGRERGDTVEIPDKYKGVPVKVIADNVFSDVTYLKKITLPSELTKIGFGAFKNCKALKEIRVPRGVTEIGDGAFSGCTDLHLSCEIAEKPSGWSESAVSDPTYVTWNCNRFFEFKLITNDGDEDYYSLVSAKGATGDIIIPNAYKTLPVYKTDVDFSDCNGITGITVCKGIKMLGISGCSGISSLDIPDGVVQVTIDNCTGLTNIVIPDSVTVLDRVSYCTALTEINIPSSVKKLGDSVFEGCVKLKEVTIPDGVTHVGSYAFLDCDSLISIVIPDKVETLELDVFYSCDNLETVTIGKGVWWIGENNFKECKSLERIIFTDTSKWYRTKLNTDFDLKSHGTQIDVSDPEDNVTEFNSEFIEGHTYMWYKK